MLQGSNLIAILIELVVGAIIIYAVYIFLGMLNLPAPIKTVVLLIIAAIALVLLAGIFGIIV